MKSKNILMIMLYNILLFSMSSCSIIDNLFDNYGSYLESIENENSSSSEVINNSSDSSNEDSFDSSNSEDINKRSSSLTLLNNAFNAIENDNNEALYDSFNLANKTQTFTNASRDNITYNAKDLEYNSNMTPSKGNVKGLVIPVDFLDNRVDENSFNEAKPSYHSVHSYYYNSSYGQLNYTFDVLDWYHLSNKASYYENLKNSKYSGEIPGVSAIIDEVFKGLDSKIDFSKYDSNNDGIIDALYIVYNHEIDYTNADFWWAYQYYYLEDTYYDKVSPYNYVFASFDFLFENNEKCNARTFIHETGHMFGLEDYYDYDSSQGYNKGGLGGYDMMDSTVGDHNPFSKMAIGWIKDPIILSSSKTDSFSITIDSYDKYGDCIIIPGASYTKGSTFNNYYVINFLNTDSRLLKDENKSINLPGIRVYEVNAELYTYTDEYGSYEYYRYNNSYTAKNLINAINHSSSITSSSHTSIYNRLEYDTLCASNKDLFHQGNHCALSINGLTYNMSVDELDLQNLTCTLSFTIS
ncbi:MAG: M6 family metalloprotease domain-containing protein [Erysipelotrichaceae bacterium]|nr:M6 family metalloprotease domain-containing protein [Erysipelotrichaceae bacterium]